MLPTFLWIARFEGLSLLLLFFVAMPLKYGFDHPEMVEIVGWAHGLLFLAYVAGLAAVGLPRRWSLVRLALGFVAAFVPFGTFAFERSLQDPTPALS